MMMDRIGDSHHRVNLQIYIGGGIKSIARVLRFG